MSPASRSTAHDASDAADATRDAERTSHYGRDQHQRQTSATYHDHAHARGGTGDGQQQQQHGGSQHHPQGQNDHNSLPGKSDDSSDKDGENKGNPKGEKGKGGKQSPGKTSPRPDTYFANERTFLSWMRTGVELMILGFILSTFAVQATGMGLPHSLFGPGAGNYIGAAIVSLVAVVTILAYIRYRNNSHSITSGTFSDSPTLTLALAVIMVIIAVTVAIYIASS